MRGWLVVQPHPYVAISTADGKFGIKNLPVGTWEFQVWQESVGYVTKVSRHGQPVEWKRGRFTLEIKPGENDLGEIKWSKE